MTEENELLFELLELFSSFPALKEERDAPNPRLEDGYWYRPQIRTFEEIRDWCAKLHALVLSYGYVVLTCKKCLSISVVPKRFKGKIVCDKCKDFMISFDERG